MKIAVHISNTEWYTLQAQGMIVLVPDHKDLTGNKPFVYIDIGGASGEHHQVVRPEDKSLATTMLPVVV